MCPQVFALTSQAKAVLCDIRCAAGLGMWALSAMLLSLQVKKDTLFSLNFAKKAFVADLCFELYSYPSRTQRVRPKFSLGRIS